MFHLYSWITDWFYTKDWQGYLSRKQNKIFHTTCSFVLFCFILLYFALFYLPKNTGTHWLSSNPFDYQLNSLRYFLQNSQNSDNFLNMNCTELKVNFGIQTKLTSFYTHFTNQSVNHLIDKITNRLTVKITVLLFFQHSQINNGTGLILSKSSSVFCRILVQFF